MKAPLMLNRDEKLSVAANLRRAADIMIKDGYVKGITYDYITGAHCALGAIIESGVCSVYSSLETQQLAVMISDRFERGPVYDEHNCTSVDHNSPPSSKVAAWNNMLCNSAEEVACVMRATAELLEEEAADEDN